MARQRSYAPSNYSSSTAKSFSGSATTKSAQDNRSTYNRENYRTSQYTSPTSAPKTKTYTTVNQNNDTTSTSTIKQSTLNKYKKKPKKKTVVTFDGGGSDNNNTIKKVTETAPTVAEVSQVTTADAAAEDTEANRLLKIKKKGRSKSILTGSQGVTKMAADYSLGMKSLLGRV